MDRIDELIKQATHDCMGVPVLDRREFARLIVQECLDIVNRKEYSYHEADPLWETSQLIKQHFGVE
jgi:hypothetical protein